MGGCMGQWVGSGQMTNLIKLELINIIWFCLKIYNLSRHPYLWVDGWVNGWAHVKPLKSNKSWPNRDNSIMDILDILLDILLKPPQPFIGLFLVSGTLGTQTPFSLIWMLLNKGCGSTANMQVSISLNLPKQMPSAQHACMYVLCLSLIHTDILLFAMSTSLSW